MSRARRRLGAVAGLALAVSALVAPPVGADAAGPTDYRTEVLGLDPAVAGVTASVVGGDSFLQLEVEPGIEVLVVGYRGEPFIRFLPSGAVEENRSAPSWYLSQDRFAAAEVPAGLTEDAAPSWVRVADDGTWAWHDHRTHWMGADRPPGVEPGDVVLEAVVPLVVDGGDVELSVRSTLVATPSPVPAIIGAVGGLTLLYGLGRALGRIPGSAVAVGLVAAAALLVGAWQVRSIPPETGPSRLHWVLALAALLPAFAGAAMAWRDPAGRRLLARSLTALAAAELTIWGWTRRDGLNHALLPTDAPHALDRAVTAAALVVGAITFVMMLVALLREPAPMPARGRVPGT